MIGTRRLHGVARPARCAAACVWRLGRHGVSPSAGRWPGATASEHLAAITAAVLPRHRRFPPL